MDDKVKMMTYEETSVLVDKLADALKLVLKENNVAWTKIQASIKTGNLVFTIMGEQ